MTLHARPKPRFSEQTLVRTEPGMREAVREAARRRGITMTALMRDALQAAIANPTAERAQ